MKFSDFKLNDTILDALFYMNYEEATEIQEKAIPIILEGGDLIGCAQTGTGKTAAFVLPTLHQVAEEHSDGVQVLILCPTRELAIQIDQQVQGLAYFTNATCYAVYGGGDGVSWEAEAEALKGGADIIVATPGRLLAHIARGYVRFDTVKHLILDEADRMLDIGFHDDILKIMKYLPEQRQSLMFSATMAPKIRKLAKEILSDPHEINVAISKPAEGVTQLVYMAHESQKVRLVQHILAQHEDFTSIIIFCSTKRKVEQLTRKLQQRKYACLGVSSDYDQEQREEALREFKSGRIRVMVATDVMSRGIDIKGIDLVVNFDVPTDAEDYVHRIGRTARAKTEGMAVTLISEDDSYRFSRIETLIERTLDKLQPPAELGEGPEWREPEKKGRRRSKGKSKGPSGSARSASGSGGRGSSSKGPGSKGSDGRDSGGRADSASSSKGSGSKGSDGRDSGGRDSGGRAGSASGSGAKGSDEANHTVPKTNSANHIRKSSTTSEKTDQPKEQKSSNKRRNFKRRPSKSNGQNDRTASSPKTS